MPSLRFLDFGHRKLAVDALGQEANAIAGLHRFQHRWIAGAERHSHARVHVKLLDWAVFDYDFAGGLVDPGDFPHYVFVRLRHCGWQVSAKPEHQSREGDVLSWWHCDLVCGSAVHYFTMIFPCMPAS